MHPREECLVFENTQPSLITQEVWGIVQQVRKNRRRPKQMEKQSKYSGLVFWAASPRSSSRCFPAAIRKSRIESPQTVEIYYNGIGYVGKQQDVKSP